MEKRTYVAVTGGIGSGKSTVCALLKEKGYPVFSCDEIYKKVIVSPDFVESIKRAFPTAVEKGTIDRKKLAEIVFNDPSALSLLNSLSHPAIMKKLRFEMQKIEKGLVFAEVPLLFEGHYERLFDYVLIVKRNKESRMSAVIARDNTNEEAVVKRMENQIDHEKIPSSDVVFKLKNDGDLKDLENGLNDFLKKLQ